MNRRMPAAAAVVVVSAVAVGAVLLFSRADQAARDLLNRAAHSAGFSVEVTGKVRLGLLPPALHAERAAFTRDGALIAEIRRISAALSGADLLLGRFTPVGGSLDHLRIPALDKTIDRIDARFSDNRIEASVKVGDVALIAAGTNGPEGADFRLTIPAAGASLRFQGEASSWDRFGGHVWFVPGKAEIWTGLQGWPVDPGMGADADVEFGDGQLLIANLKAQGAGSRADGAASLLLGEPLLIEADLTIDRLDVDQWRLSRAPAAPAQALPAPVAPAPVVPAAQPAETAQAAQPPTAFALPADIAASVSLTVDELRAGGAIMRNLALAGGAEFGALVLRELSADLPGEAKAAASGSYADGRLDGKITVKSPKGDIAARIAGDLSNVKAAPFSLRSPSLNAQGELTLQRGEVPRISWNGDIGHMRGVAASAGLRWGADSVSASDLAVSWGKHAVSGALSAELAGEMPRIRGALRGGVIDLADFTAQPQAPQARQAGKTAKTTAAKQTPPAPRKSGKAKPDQGWSATPLPWPELPKMDLELDVAADSLVGSDWRLSEPKARLRLAENRVELSNIAAGLWKGVLTGAASATTGPAPSVAGEFDLNGADAGALGLESAGMRLTSGALSANAKLLSAGAAPRDLIAALSGTVRATIADGAFSGADLAAINRQAGNLRNLGNVLALLQAGLNGGTTHFKRLNADFRIRDGIASAAALNMDADGAKAEGDLVVDLPRRQLDGRIDAALNALPDAPLGLGASGPWAAPRYKVHADALQKALLQGGLGQALKGGDEDGGSKKPKLKDLFRLFKGN